MSFASTEVPMSLTKMIDSQSRLQLAELARLAQPAGSTRAPVSIDVDYVWIHDLLDERTSASAS
jgi:hypothetical protein